MTEPGKKLELRQILSQPFVLRGDSFVPAEDTPWGGDKIAKTFKSFLPELPPRQVIGESWEFSLSDEEYGSRARDFDVFLPDVLKNTNLAREAGLLYPAGLKDGDAGEGKTPTGSPKNEPKEFLLKLIDAKENLSFQLHPEFEDSSLAPGESGKSESWYILSAEPGAGIYLGFRSGVDAKAFKQAALTGQSLTEFLHFETVRAGDFISIPAGTPHAIGAGLVLVESQVIGAGKRGKTLRLWDWDKEYPVDFNNPQGPWYKRKLEPEKSLEYVDFGSHVGKKLISKLRLKPNRLAHGGVTEQMFSDCTLGCIQEFHFSEPTFFTVAQPRAYHIFLVLEGELVFKDNEGKSVTCEKGRCTMQTRLAGRVEMSAVKDCLVVAFSVSGDRILLSDIRAGAS